MASRIYTAIGIIALLVMVYILSKNWQQTGRALVWTVTLLYATVVGCVHGVMAHTLTARQKVSLIFYPIFMGAVFAVFIYIYLYLILPGIT